MILKSNELRKKAVEDKNVRKEGEKIEERVKALERDLLKNEQSLHEVNTFTLPNKKA